MEINERGTGPRDATTAHDRSRVIKKSHALLMWVLAAAAIAIAVVAITAGIVTRVWQREPQSVLVDGIESGNGRLEAREYDIATRIAGRLADLTITEGDEVRAGQIVGRIDTAELVAQLEEAQAQRRQAAAAAESASVMVRQRESERALAQLELGRADRLHKLLAVSTEQLDRARTSDVAASVAVRAARAQVTAAQATMEASAATVRRIQTYLDEAELRAPVDGRVLYRLAEPGEVLAVGGRVATVLDLSDVFITVFLPTDQVGRLPVGAEARVVLDAADAYVFPARVSFVSPEAQFTPKEVETRSERDKLMFRVKVQIDRELLRRYSSRVKPGMPGLAYVRTRTETAWPAPLAVKLPP